MKRAFYIDTKVKEIADAQTHVEQILKQWKIKDIDIDQASRSLKELLVKMIKVSTETKLKIEVHKLFGDCLIRVSGRGVPLREEEVPTGFTMPELSDVDSEQESIIRNFILKSYGKRVSVHNKKGLNVASILVETSKQRALRRTLFALTCGVFVGVGLKVLGPSIATTFADTFFVPMYTMFLNAIKMLAAPLVFFSIASAVAGNRDMRQMGKLSAKVFGLFVLTSFIAICVALACYWLLPLGDASLAQTVTDSADSIAKTASTTSISLKNTIINIIPADILTPFFKSDMLQVLFLAFLTGLGVTKLGASAAAVNHGLDMLNDLFLKITKIIIKFMPLSIFCSMADMVIRTDVTSLFSVTQWLALTTLGYVVMLIVYAIMFPLLTRLSPIRFFKKFAPVMLNAFVLCSGNAVMPFNMEICRTKMGISTKAYSFAIPLGTVLNKNGGCIALMVSALFMASIFGVPIAPGMMTSIVLMVYVLSVAAPAIPGSILLCIAMLLPMMGIPANAISIIMGIYAFDAMVQTIINVTGTATCTMIAARSENMVDMKVWNED